MTLPIPKLDDRHFQDIVDEAKKRIPHFCPEWTDHNVSDPGVTLIELFAWMTDLVLYRLNQVPDLHKIRFLELLGITLREPVPAHVPVTFWLSAPQPVTIVIPAGTEVASTQTETERSIVFTTDADLRVRPPGLQEVVSRVTLSGGAKAYQHHPLPQLQAGFQGIDVFSPVPQLDDALYFGFGNDLSNHVLGLEFLWDSAYGGGIRPDAPPQVWEASSSSPERRWEPCEVELDTTKGMNAPGQVRLHLPVLGRRRIEAQDCFWVRARITRAWSPDHPAGAQDDAYFKSPRLRQLSAVSWGGTVPATHAQYVMHEFLGQSDGSPGQRFPLQRHPILQRQPGETLTVQVENQPPQSWTETTDFADATGSDRHFSLDGANGELRLGPAVRQPDGTIKLYGAIPPRGANLIFERYRVGGGQAGNVHAGLLNTLKTSIPYVDRVENRKPAIGGLDAETLEDALVRAPALLRSRDRAVTEADFEFLASQALPEAIGRVKCLQPRPDEAGRVLPGQVYVLIIPRVADPDGYIAPEQLEPRSEQIAALAAYLDERRLLTTRVNIQRPEYQAVAVKVRLRAAIGADQATVRATVLSRLYRFLNPLTGWTDGKGWLFGRTLYLSDIYQCLQGLRDVQFIRSADLRLADKDGVAQGESQESVEIVAHGVIISGRHEVELV